MCKREYPDPFPKLNVRRDALVHLVVIVHAEPCVGLDGVPGVPAWSCPLPLPLAWPLAPPPLWPFASRRLAWPLFLLWPLRFAFPLPAIRPLPLVPDAGLATAVDISSSTADPC